MNNMTFIPNLHILWGRLHFFIPVQPTFEWPLQTRSALLATLMAISFTPYNNLQSRYYYSHYSWKKKSVLKEGKWLIPKHPDTELKFKLESFGLQVFLLDSKNELPEGFRNLTNDRPLRLPWWVTTNTRFSNSLSRFLRHITALPPKVPGFPKGCLDGIPSQRDANRSDPHSSSWINKNSKRAEPILCA